MADRTDDVTDDEETDDEVLDADAQAEGSSSDVAAADDEDDDAADDPSDEGTGSGEVGDEDDDAAAGTGAKVKKVPFDPKADVAARRAATKERLDQGKGPAKAAAPMAKATAADPTGTRAKKAEAGAKKVVRTSKRTGGTDPKVARKAAARSGNPRKAAQAADTSRYTAPIPRAQIESPTWVPVLMFTLLGLGGVVVLLTYMLWEGRPLALGAGLVLILGGILTATQYR